MAIKKKLSPAARAASVMKAIASAEKSAMQAFFSWGRTTEKAVAASERELAASARKAGSIRTRAGNALKRVQRARAKDVKAVASNARKLILADLANARAALKTARESHASAKAAQKLFLMIAKGMASGVQAAEKAAQPRKSRRRRRKALPA